MLNPQKIQEFTERLEEDRVRLFEEYERLEKPDDFGHDVEDNSEEQEEAESLSSNLAAGQTIKERINEIDAALNKMRMGKYGVCEKCGKEISEGELDIVPESRLCESCKASADKR